MSPEAARIFYVDDNDSFTEVTTRYLERAGHRVVLTATSLKDALDKIPQLRDFGVQVALVDGNLSPMARSCLDGKTVAAEIRRVDPDIKIIGISNKEDIAGVDVNSHKRDGAEKIAETVTQI